MRFIAILFLGWFVFFLLVFAVLYIFLALLLVDGLLVYSEVLNG